MCQSISLNNQQQTQNVSEPWAAGDLWQKQKHHRDERRQTRMLSVLESAAALLKLHGDNSEAKCRGCSSQHGIQSVDTSCAV